jgi:hypothetical protein
VASALDTARSGIEARLNSGWSTTPVAWQGVEFDAGEADWIRPTLVFNVGEMETYGASGVNTVEGLLLLDVFTVTKAGLGDLYGYVDTLRDLFDRATVGAIEFGAAGGPREIPDDQWRQLQFEVPFIIEETS